MIIVIGIITRWLLYMFLILLLLLLMIVMIVLVVMIAIMNVGIAILCFGYFDSYVILNIMITIIIVNGQPPRTP